MGDHDRLDVGFDKFYETLCDAAKTTKIQLIDPFDAASRRKLLNVLQGAKKIENPGETFGMQISGKARAALKDQLNMHIHMIKHVGVKQRHYQLAA